MHSIPMSLKNMFLISFHLKTMLLYPYVRMLLCLQSLCHWKYVLLSLRLKLCYYTLVFVCYYVFIRVLLSYTKAPPSFWGWGCVPQERENQINTLVLKDINFTINIIDCLITERLIPWINLKNAPVVKASPSPSKGGDVLIAYSLK